MTIKVSTKVPTACRKGIKEWLERAPAHMYVDGRSPRIVKRNVPPHVSRRTGRIYLRRPEVK